MYASLAFNELIIRGCMDDMGIYKHVMRHRILLYGLRKDQKKIRYNDLFAG